MDNFVLLLIFRWMHILAAITAVGGTIFMRTSLLPAAETLPEEEHRKLREQVRSRWSKLVMMSIGFLLISGIYNIMVIVQSKQPLPKFYHPLFGIKFLLALGIFFLASALVGRSPAMQRFRDNAKTWSTVNVLLAVVLVCISGTLRIGRDQAAKSLPQQPTVETPADPTS